MEWLIQATPLVWGIVGVGGKTGRGNTHPPYTRRPFRTVELKACSFVFPHSLHKQPPSTFMSIHPPRHTHTEGCAHIPMNILTHNLHTYIPIGFLPKVLLGTQSWRLWHFMTLLCHKPGSKTSFRENTSPLRGKEEAKKNSIVVVAFSDSLCKE